MATIWVHRVRYGAVLVREVTVEKETPKQYVVRGGPVTGYKSRLPKDAPYISATREEAVVKAQAEIEGKIDGLQRQIDALLSMRATLRGPDERCDHPWHANPGLIPPCPGCGEEV